MAAAAAAAGHLLVIGGAESDLSFCFNSAELGLEHQATIVAAGYRSISRYSCMADDRPGMRTASAAVLGFVEPLTADNRLTLAKMVEAWESARRFVAKQDDLRAEAKVMNVVRPATTQEKVAMRKAAERVLGDKLPELWTPSSDYLAAKLEEVELDEPQAAPLDEILSVEAAESGEVSASFDASGRLRVSKGRSKGVLPTTTEEYRLKMRIEATTWLMISCKCVNRPWLQGYATGHFENYVDWILGEKVLLMSVPGLNGMSSLQPPWSLFLHFDAACRKSAMKRVREEGVTIGEALKLVMKDSELKELHWTSPPALAPRASSSSSSYQLPAIFKSSSVIDPRLQQQQQMAAAKAAELQAAAAGGNTLAAALKMKKVRKPKKIPNKLLPVKGTVQNAPDGRQICFNFNSASGCSGACARVHICRRTGCGGSHSILNCPNSTTE